MGVFCYPVVTRRCAVSSLFGVSWFLALASISLARDINLLTLFGLFRNAFKILVRTAFVIIRGFILSTSLSRFLCFLRSVAFNLEMVRLLSGVLSKVLRILLTFVSERFSDLRCLDNSVRSFARFSLFRIDLRLRAFVSKSTHYPV